MTPAEVVNPPPSVALLNYPGLTTGVFAVVFSSLLLYIAGKFDPTGGPLTISILIVLGMLGATAYCLIFTIPVDDITPGVVGGLTAGFGAVVAYWLGRTQTGGNREDRPHRPPKEGPEGE